MLTILSTKHSNGKYETKIGNNHNNNYSLQKSNVILLVFN